MKTENPSILQLTQLSIGYQTPLLSEITTSIEKGEIILLLGKNGSGKTTLLKTIFKELSSLSGSIKIAGKDISQLPVSETGKLLSVVFSQSEISPSLKVYDLLALGRYPYKKWYQSLSQQENTAIKDMIILLGLEKYKEYYVSELSDGNLQKALIARALIQDCPLLILDEPTSFLDISNKLEIMKLLKYLSKEKNKTILFTSHDLNLSLAIADKIWLIKENELITGYTEDLANQESILDYFAGKHIQFDYSSNEYEYISTEKRKEIQLLGNSQSLYWLQKALVRNQFAIAPQADTLISENDSVFTIYQQEQRNSYSTIKEVIDFLNKL